MKEQSEITVNDLRDFLKTYMRPQDYDRLILLLCSKKDFRLMFKLTELIGEVQHLIIFTKNGHFGVQFIPQHIASAPLPDTLIPDTIVFVNK